ncbi:MAG: ATP-binding cassette domain-containing protein [Oscillospiraceae bacterium]|jgi:polar amino acid transport system ATP-binding protein|nr:ATP-binding cassette domain-containing protein [Oscillospiraceae bacterium]
MKTIETVNLCKNFGGKEILKNINFSAQNGEITAITGKSGEGKTTFLRCLAGLEKIDSGSIKIEDNCLVKDGIYVKNTSKILKKVGLIFQNFNLFPHLTVKENIEIPALNAKMYETRAIFDVSQKLLKQFKLENVQNSFPSNLSGGQKQRAAIARALILNPDIILFDEPTSSLDPELVEELTEIIKKLSKQNYTILIVTHDTGFANQTADRILALKDGDLPAV